METAGLSGKWVVTGLFRKLQRNRKGLECF